MQKLVDKLLRRVYHLAINKKGDNIMKKLIAITLAALMVMSLAACAAKEAAPAATEAAAEAPAFTTVQPGKLIMVTNAAFPPYEFIADDGSTITGIDAEICGMIAKELGLELQIEDMEFASLLTAVQTGRKDRKAC